MSFRNLVIDFGIRSTGYIFRLSPKKSVSVEMTRSMSLVKVEGRGEGKDRFKDRNVKLNIERRPV